MKRNWMIGLALLALAAAPAAVAQETILGFLEPPVVNDRRPGQDGPDKPGVIRVFGWVLSDSGIRRVVIQVDGVDYGQAVYGQHRPLVQNQWPFFPDSAGAGFGINVNGTDFLNGLHQITAKVTTNGGEEIILPAVEPDGTIAFDGIQEVFWSYSTANLHPFGGIDFPQRNASLYGTCNRSNPFRRYSPITGWALDLGVEDGDAGVGYVELLVDGAIWGNSRINCRFNVFAGGLTDCYGLPRLDIERRYPFALDATNAGFRFALDVGFLLDNSYAQGHHTLTIRVGDIKSQVQNVAEIPVNFFCVENLFNEDSFGLIETPRPGRAFSDSIDFVGWALDGEGVRRVDVYVDGEFLGEADFGIGQGTRPFVLSNFPGFPDSLAPVWSLRNIDSRIFSDGNHQVQVFVIDRVGESTLIGESTFLVNNVEDEP